MATHGLLQGRALAAAGAVAAVAGLAAHSLSYLPYFTDDGYISLRYAQRLLAGDGLTFNDGEWVEGYSNLLWVLGVAALGATGLDLVTAARAIGLGALSAAVVVLAVAKRPEDDGSPVPGWTAAALVAASGPPALWAIAGLEQGLVAGLLVGAIVLSWPLLEPGPSAPWRPWAVGALLALLCWTRPDGPLFSGCAVLGLLLARRDRAALGTAARIACLPILAVAGQTTFRLLYYGDWVPNTAHVKLAFSWLRVQQGATYVSEGLAAMVPLVAAGLASLAVVRQEGRGRRVLFTAVFLVGWTAYVVAIGGDIFRSRRHLIPDMVLLALLAAEVVGTLGRGGGRRQAIAAACAVGLLATHVWTQRADHKVRNILAWNMARNGEVVGRLLKRAFGDADPLVAAGAAGALPYFSGLTVIDLYGLNDRHIATTGVGGRLGHPTLGDPGYVFGREPDILQFHQLEGVRRPTGPMGKVLGRHPAMKRYHPIAFRGTDPRRFTSILWVRVDSPRIGIRRERDRVEVPGFLLAGDKKNLALLDRDGRLGARATPKAPLVSAPFALPPGAWAARAQAAAPVQIRVHGSDAPVATPWVHPGGEARLEVHVERGSSHVRSVTLDRIDAP